MRGLLAAVLLSATLVLALRAVTPLLPPEAHPAWDHTRYLSMASGQGAPLPFGARVLAPWLVHQSHLPPATGFHVVTLLCLWALGIGVYVVLIAHAVTPTYALIGVAATYLCLPLAIFSLWDVYLADPLAILFLLAAVYAAATRSPWLFLFALAVGVLAKESVLIAAPLWWTYQPSRRTALESIALTTPPMLLFLGIRHGIPTSEAPGLQWPIHPGVPLQAYLPFGVLPLCAVFGGRENLDVLKRWSLSLALVYAQLCVAVNTDRLVVWGFVPVVLMAIQGISRVGCLGHVGKSGPAPSTASAAGSRRLPDPHPHRAS